MSLLDIRRDPNVLYDAVTAATSGEADETQARALAQNASRFVDWMAQHGAKFLRLVYLPRHPLSPAKNYIKGGSILGELINITDVCPFGVKL